MGTQESSAAVEMAAFDSGVPCRDDTVGAAVTHGRGSRDSVAARRLRRLQCLNFQREVVDPSSMERSGFDPQEEEPLLPRSRGTSRRGRGSSEAGGRAGRGNGRRGTARGVWQQGRGVGVGQQGRSVGVGQLGTSVGVGQQQALIVLIELFRIELVINIWCSACRNGRRFWRLLFRWGLCYDQLMRYEQVQVQQGRCKGVMTVVRTISCRACGGRHGREVICEPLRREGTGQDDEGEGSSGDELEDITDEVCDDSSDENNGEGGNVAHVIFTRSHTGLETDAQATATTPEGNQGQGQQPVAEESPNLVQVGTQESSAAVEMAAFDSGVPCRDDTVGAAVTHGRGSRDSVAARRLRRLQCLNFQREVVDPSSMERSGFDPQEEEPLLPRSRGTSRRGRGSSEAGGRAGRGNGRRGTARGVWQQGRGVGVGQQGRSVGVGQLGTSVGVGQQGRSVGVGQLGRAVGVGQPGTSVGVGQQGRSVGVGQLGTSVGVGQQGSSVGVGQLGTSVGVGQQGRAVGVGQPGTSVGVGQPGRGVMVQPGLVQQGRGVAMQQRSGGVTMAQTGGGQQGSGVTTGWQGTGGVMGLQGSGLATRQQWSGLGMGQTGGGAAREWGDYGTAGDGRGDGAAREWGDYGMAGDGMGDGAAREWTGYGTAMEGCWNDAARQGRGYGSLQVCGNAAALVG
ncbi:unnamed protein product [Closterium sp. NIES-64]|nr:unnamed protein product [Closterium sp. NIES-64]